MIAGIDTGSNAMGIAVVSPASTPWIELLGSVHRGDREVHEIAADACGRLAPYLEPGAQLGIEEPPPTVPKRVRHGPQAVIGWKLGLVAGHVGAVARQRGASVAFVRVSDHRAHMLAFLARRGHLLPRPGDQPPPPPPRGGPKVLREVDLLRSGRMLLLRWRACGHEHDITLGGLETAPETCTTCALTPRRAAGPEEIRDQWKRTACRGVELVWPRNYAELVANPRARARTTTPDWKLAGVADAAEALWVAIYLGQLS